MLYHRITLEDDEDEDLDVEPAPRRPVLVISDSLKEGLQCGISDILPQTVAQSVYVTLIQLWSFPYEFFLHTYSEKEHVFSKSRKEKRKGTPENHWVEVYCMWRKKLLQLLSLLNRWLKHDKELYPDQLFP